MITIPDIMPAGFDHQLDRTRILSMDAFKLATPQELTATGMAMGICASDGKIVISTEHDQNRLIEWTIFHVRREGKPLIKILLEGMPPNTDATERAILTAMADSAWGLYRIESLRSGVGAVMTDLWRGTTHLVYSRLIHQSTRPGDSIMARLFVAGEITTMAVLISMMPTGFMDGLREVQAQGFLSDAKLANDGDTQETFAATVFATRSTPSTTAHLQPGQGRMSGRNRNQPCPCGSGRKFKVCCGRGG